jgi:general secretion pathway protein B
MSSILKALRKLESDKSALGEGSVDLSRDILKRSYQQQTANSPTAWYLLFGILLSGVLVAAFFWPTATVENSIPATTELLNPSIPTVKNLDPVILPKAESNTPVVVAERQTVKAVSKEVPLSPVKVPHKLPTKAAELKTSKSSQRVFPTAPLVIPDLRVEEIAYQQQPSARLAVINDLPVMEGTDIEGAHVMEILPDRVRFSYQGVLFDKFTLPVQR